MIKDIHLHCSAGLLKNRIEIHDPEELRKTPSGKMIPPPEEWRKGNRLIANIDVVNNWVRAIVGNDILRSINRYALAADNLTRVLISCNKKRRDEVLPVPWELLENTPVALRSARLVVVRLLDPDVPTGEVESVTKLRLLVLYADPTENIAQMKSHIEGLRNFASENEETLQMKFLCFEDAFHVLNRCVGFDPHVVYFIGHGSQTGVDQVHLQIGAPGKADHINLSDFADLLQRIGSPRLVILNACEGFAGGSLDPYLGAALRLSPRFDYIVAMQMVEPIPSATRFAATFLAAVGGQEGLAIAMAKARSAMAITADPDFQMTPYIPVLMQRILQDLPYSVDMDSQELARLQKLMASRLELIDRFPRKTDAAIRDAISCKAACRVSILTGPPDCGKSTSVRGVLRDLLEVGEIKQGNRYLYFSAKELLLTNGSTNQIQNLLQTFARSCGPFTDSLIEILSSSYNKDPEIALAGLATWLGRQKEAGRRFSIVLDDLPSQLATNVAELACRVVTSGCLMVVSDRHTLPDNVKVERITMGVMTVDEIMKAFPKFNRNEVQSIAEDSGGIPMLVAAKARGEEGSVRELVTRLVESSSRGEQGLLHMIAVSELPLSPEIIAALRVDASVVESTARLPLVSLMGDKAFSMPRLVRQEVLSSLKPEAEYHVRQSTAKALQNVAYREQTGGFRRARVIELYREALHQQVRMLNLAPQDEATLTEAQKDMFDLDYQLLEEGDEPVEAEANWNVYRRAALESGASDDRESDVRYARCLQRIGLVKEANQILSDWTSAEISDDLQIQTLLLHADILKDLGEKESMNRRINLLHRAMEIVTKLREAGNHTMSLDIHEGNIEHSLGNALGYGEDAQPHVAIEHVTRAMEIFAPLHDYRAERAYAEKIEIARYNGQLSENDRLDSIKKIREGVECLFTRSTRYDRILRLYELGRLETDPHRRVQCFREAYEYAGDAYAPLRWHAAIHWKCAEVEADESRFLRVAQEIVDFCEMLKPWQEKSWSRRVLRDAYLFLADHYHALGQDEQHGEFLNKCREVIAVIERQGEGRRDRSIRERVEKEVSGFQPSH